MSRKNNDGSALIVILLLMAALGAVVYGLTVLTAISQSNNNLRGDLLLARNYAQLALFDSVTGGLGKILAFESSAFSATTYGVSRVESMTVFNRQLLKGNYFTAACNNGPSLPSGFSKGLCSTESAIANGNSTPLLRVGTTVVKPCRSYSLTSVISGQTLLPLIDDGNSNYSMVYDTGDSSLCHQPNFTLELMNPEFEINGFVNRARLYRVTVRAFGRNGDTQATMQGYFYVRCPNNVCQSALLSSYLLD